MYYPELTLSQWEKETLRIALDRQRKFLSYNYNKKLCSTESTGRVNEWLSQKDYLDLLPEQRVAVGSLVVALCAAFPEFKELQPVKDWYHEMREDPLSDMRQLAEEITLVSPDMKE